MDVKIGRGLFDRAHQIHIEHSIQPGGQPRLHAHLRGPHFAGLQRAAHHLLLGQEITLAGGVPAGKSAEAAMLHANIGEVDVAVDHIGDPAAHHFAAEPVGHGDEGKQFAPRSLELAGTLRHGDLTAFQGPLQDGGHFAPRAGKVDAGAGGRGRRDDWRFNWLGHGVPEGLGGVR